MKPAQKGVYADLLAHSWLEGSIPDDPDELAELLRLSRREFDPIWKVVRQHFTVEKGPGKLANQRLEMEREKADRKSQHGRNAAGTRWGIDADALPDGTASAMPQIRSDQITADQKKKTAAEPPQDQGSFKLDSQQPKPEPNPMRKEAIEVLAHYRAEWVRLMAPTDGRPPDVSDADWGQLSRLVKAHGRDVVIGFVDRYLADTHPAATSNGHALRNLPSRVNAYRVGRALAPSSNPFAPNRAEPPAYRSVEQVERDRELARERLDREREERDRERERRKSGGEAE